MSARVGCSRHECAGNAWAVRALEAKGEDEMSDNVKMQHVDASELAAIEGGNFIGDFFHGIGKVANAVGDFFDSLF
jgi:hypothetical protein